MSTKAREGMTGDTSYEGFLETKRVTAPATGIPKPPPLNEALFPLQAESVAWALRQGRAALFLGCGLGKTFCQLEWGRVVAEHTKLPVLLFAPLAVGPQTVAEAERFGVACPVRQVKEQSEVGPGINIANYERVERFDPSAFGGVILDESGILKSYTGKTKNALVDRFKQTPFKLACTATPAPNDHMELGNHCEFLGVMSSHEMLARWFINDLSTFGTYRLKGHAAEAFWDWVASWARAAETPEDLGHDGAGYRLPPMTITAVEVQVDLTEGRKDGQLFRMPEMSATSVHAEKRRTVNERAEAIAALVKAEPDEAWLIWSETDYEADALLNVLPAAFDVRGSDTPEAKEQGLLGFSRGEIRYLVSKPKLAGFGLNWQHCARVAFLGPTFSYESFYQAIRRCWRFGQARSVKVFVALAPTERHIFSILNRKADGHETMKTAMADAMRRAHAKASPKLAYLPTVTARIPAWLKAS